eukprot:Hpha_TRINITY_DN15241_c2_g9::TRINITY_DN15241_c2_g9_i2::g.66300::m.66300
MEWTPPRQINSARVRSSQATTEETEQRLNELRKAISDLVLETRNGELQFQALRQLTRQHQLLCGPGRVLVTQPLLHALNSRVAALGKFGGWKNPVVDRIDCIQALMALTVLGDLAWAGMSPRSVPPAHDDVEPRGVTHSQLIASACSVVEVLRSDRLLAADVSSPSELKRARDMRMPVLSRAWGLLGALSAEEPLAPSVHFSEILNSPTMVRDIITNSDCFREFFRAVSACACSLGISGERARAVGLFKDLFRLDPHPEPPPRKKHKTRGEPWFPVDDPYQQLNNHIWCLKNWMDFRMVVANGCRYLLYYGAPNGDGDGWLDWMKSVVPWSSSNLKVGRVRSHVLEALRSLFNEGGPMSCSWTAVLCAIVRSEEPALSRSQQRQADEMCREFFLSDRQAATGAFAHLPEPMRDNAGNLVKVVAASAARHLQTSITPSWLRSCTDEEMQGLREATERAFIQGVLADSHLFADGKFNQFFLHYAKEHQETIGVYRLLIARLLTAIGIGGSARKGPVFAAALARHAASVWTEVNRLWSAKKQQGPTAQWWYVRTLFRFGAKNFAAFARVVGEAAESASPEEALSLYNALSLYWRLYGESNSPGRREEDAARRRQTYYLLVTALRRLVVSLPVSVAASSVEAAQVLSESVTPNAMNELQLRWELLALRTWMERQRLPEATTANVLDVVFRVISHHRDRDQVLLRQQSVSERRQTAHELLMVCLLHPSPASVAALPRYAHACIYRGSGIFPPMRLVALFADTLPLLCQNVESWSEEAARDAIRSMSNKPVRVRENPGIGGLLYILRLCAEAVSLLNAEEEKAPPAMRRRLRRYRAMYSLCATSFLGCQSSRLVESAVVTCEKLLRSIKRKDDVRFWLTQTARGLRYSNGSAGKARLALWLIRLREELVGDGLPTVTPKL